MKSITHYIILTARRDLLFIGVIVLMILTLGGSIFFGNVMLVEQQQASTILAASNMRIICAFGTILFVCFHARRCFENKEVELILSKSVTRLRFVFAYFTGFVVLSTVLLLIASLLLYLGARLSFLQVSINGLLLWSATFAVELWIVIGFSLFISVMLNSAVSSALLSISFYCLSRVYGFFLLGSATEEGSIKSVQEYFVKGVSIFIPRLDMYTNSGWLIYDAKFCMDEVILLLGGGIYILFILALTAFDFVRKQF